MSTAMIQSGGMQSVRKRQLVYLDFDGESTSYRGEIMQLEHVELGSSRLDAEAIAAIVSKLNSEAEDVFYVTERPVDVPYSTVFVGYTTSFVPYGDFAGLAETIDHGNQRPDDNAFVILKGSENADAIADTIAHEVAHLTGTLDHGGNGLTAYAYGNTCEVSSGVTSTNVVLDADDMFVYSGGVANSTTVNSSGSITIFSGGVTNSTSMNYGGYMFVYSGGVVNSITVNAGGSMWIGSGGSALNVIWTPCVGTIYALDGAYVTYQSSYSGCYFGSSNQLLSQGMTMIGKIISGSMYIFSGGVANSTTVNDGGYMGIYSGGIANRTTANGGSMYISSGGVANSTTVNAEGYMRIYSGGSAVNVIWTPCVGKIRIQEGAYVTYQSSYSGCYFGSDNQLLSQGMTMSSKIVSASVSMFIFSGGVANDTIVNDVGSMSIASGGVGNNTNVSFNGFMSISSGGVANSTTMNSGYMTISSGGVANRTNVNEGGWMSIQSGGVAHSTAVSAGGSMTISSGGIANNTILSEWGTMTVSSGGVANSTTVNAGGSMTISSGVVANNTTVNGDSYYGGYVTISAGGVASNTTVNASGYVNISSGGVANGTTVNAGGSIYVSSGGSALNVISAPFGGGYIQIEDGAYVTYLDNFFGCYFGSDNQLLSQGMTMTGKNVSNYTGSMYIFSGGVADRTSVCDGGAIFISSGGAINSTTVNSGGSMTVFSGGVASSTTVNEGGFMTISSGGVANSTTVNSWGDMWIEGGTVSSVTVNAGGIMYILSGGSALNVIWTPCVGSVNPRDGAHVTYQSSYSGCYLGADDQLMSQSMTMTGEIVSGSMYIFSGGVANSTTVNYGEIWIDADGVANGTALDEGGYMRIYSGGVVNNTIVNSGGHMRVYSGVANDTTVNSGGDMRIYSGGKVTGSLTIADGADVIADIIDFELTGRTSSDGYLINNLSLISGAPDYTITVSATQSGGVYRLAEGADGFNQSISIGDGSVSFGSLTVNGDAVSYGYREYSLLEQDGILSLVVDQATRPAPTGLHGSAAGLSWTGLSGDGRYEIEYSRDNFVTVARFTTTGTALDSFNFADGSYQWRVRTFGGFWAEGAAFTVTGNGSRPPQAFTAPNNGVEDLFTVKTIGVWSGSYAALNTLTGETAGLTGKNRFADQFTGSNDRDVLWLTDDANGDAFFLDDRYTDRPTGTPGARFAAIDEIRAGGGDDVVDLSSFRFGYEGLAIRGGDGNDVLWANSGGNHLFGDAGNDRLTGGAEADVIAGGIGNDVLHGGGGDDIFTFGGNWGNDTVEQFAGPGNRVTLWFDGIAEADLSIEDFDGNAIFRCGDRSVTVKGLASSAITLKFGDDRTGEYQSLLAMGAFAEETTRKIYDQATGLLAAV